MSVPSAGNMGMSKELVRQERDLTHMLQPKYLWYNVWCIDGTSFLCATDWTIYAPPIPPPHFALSNPIVVETLESFPHLFDIVTSINIDCFEELLVTHSNQPFIQSICHGL